MCTHIHIGTCAPETSFKQDHIADPAARKFRTKSIISLDSQTYSDAQAEMSR